MDPKIYPEMVRLEANHWWFTGRRKILNAVINRTLRAQGSTVAPTVLEVGAGTGGNHNLLSHYGATSFVEMEPLARALFKERFPQAALYEGKLPNDLPFAPGQTFNLICLLDVLEHVEDDKAALASLKPLLAKGGDLILTVPAYQFLFGAHDKLHHHYRRYSRAGLSAILRTSGFKIKRLSYMNMLLLPAALVARGVDKLCKRETSSGTNMPAPWLNKILSGLFGAEAALIPSFNLPCGLSLLVVASRKEGAG